MYVHIVSQKTMSGRPEATLMIFSEKKKKKKKKDDVSLMNPKRILLCLWVFLSKVDKICRLQEVISTSFL